MERFVEREIKLNFLGVWLATGSQHPCGDEAMTQLVANHRNSKTKKPVKQQGRMR
jgi:hypothetical protein